MSLTSPRSQQPEPATAGSTRSLFQHEVRRDGRVVATLRATRTPDGIAVETDVFPVTAAAGEPGITRPFPFASLDHARRFADEALVAFEYLGCTVSGGTVS